MENEFDNFETSSPYSRSQALADGILVDVSNTAKEAGIQIPVAVTCAVWEEYIEWREEDNEKQTIQDKEGRLWDIIWMLRLAIKKHSNNCLHYALYIIPRDGKTRRPKLIFLKAVCSLGDNGEPVITLMKLNED